MTGAGAARGPRPARPRRVVVTGMGVVTSLGQQVGALWEAVVSGRSGVGIIRSFDSRFLPVRIASEVDATSVALGSFDRAGADVGLPPRQQLSRAALFGLAALDQAWEDSALEQALLDRRRLAVYVGASSFPVIEGDIADSAGLMSHGRCDPGSCLDVARRHPEILSQRNIPLVGTLLAQACDARGPCVTVQTACSSATQALGEAFHLIRGGRADVAISGGTDSMLSIFCVVGFTLLGAVSRAEDPARASRPFDARRDGFVLGEGAGIVVLEELEHALARGARIHAEMIGYGSSSDGYRFTDVHPNGDGAVSAMRGALASARIAADRVDYINAHGTSTLQNDRVETIAIKRVFGAHAHKLAVSSTKSQLGHLVCAAGGVEFILTALALERGVLPPTINLENRDPACDLDYVPKVARRVPLDVALSNSFGFGGQNGTVALARWQGAGSA